MNSRAGIRASLWGLGALALLLAGCQEFFTTSLASPLARPPHSLSSISADEAALLLAAKPSQDLAASAVGALADLVTAHPTAAVISDAAQIAVISTGIDTALTQALASIDVAAIIGGSGTLTNTDAATIGTLLTSAAANVSTDTNAIFTALATLASSDPTVLAANGVSPQVLIVAAIAVSVDAINTQLAPANSIADLLDGTVLPTAVTLPQAALDLAAGASALDPGNQLLSLLTGSLNIPLI